MNGFEMHGLDHVSASQANLFAAAPALWAMEKLLGIRTQPGAAAHRGTASERGVALGLFDPTAPVAHCQAAALKEFDRLTALSGDPNKEKERGAIPGIVECALAELRQYGIPTRAENGRQHKVEIRLDDVPVPVVGYLDFLWEQHGIILDLKTQLRLASAINNAHGRQGAIYLKSRGNHEMRFCYATPKKVGVYRLEDAAAHLEAIRQIFIRMERFLRLSCDRDELVGLLVPDFDHFYWNNPTTRAQGREVFGW